MRAAALLVGLAAVLAAAAGGLWWKHDGAVPPAGESAAWPALPPSDAASESGVVAPGSPSAAAAEPAGGGIARAPVAPAAPGVLVSGRLSCVGASVSIDTVAWGVQGCRCNGHHHHWSVLECRATALGDGRFALRSLPGRPVTHGRLLLLDPLYRRVVRQFRAGEENLSIELEGRSVVQLTVTSESAVARARLRSVARGPGVVHLAAARRGADGDAVGGAGAEEVAHFEHRGLLPGRYRVELRLPELVEPVWWTEVELEPCRTAVLAADLRGGFTEIEVEVENPAGDPLRAWARPPGGRREDDLQLGPMATTVLAPAGRLQLLIGREGYAPRRVLCTPPSTPVVLQENTEVVAAPAVLPALPSGVRAWRRLKVEDSGLDDAELVRLSTDRGLADLQTGEEFEWAAGDPADGALLHVGARLRLQLVLGLGDARAVAAERRFEVGAGPEQREQLDPPAAAVARAVAELSR